MIDELAEKGVAGGLRAVGAGVVVDERAHPGAELRTNDRVQGWVVLDRRAKLLGRIGRARRRLAAAANGALGPAGLIAEAVDRRILDHGRRARRIRGERRAAAMADADRRKDPQHLLERRLRDRRRRTIAGSAGTRPHHAQKEIEMRVTGGLRRLPAIRRGGQRHREHNGKGPGDARHPDQ